MSDSEPLSSILSILSENQKEKLRFVCETLQTDATSYLESAIRERISADFENLCPEILLCNSESELES